MSNRIYNISQKVRNKGCGWLFERIKQEFRTPNTPLGKFIFPFYKSFALFWKNLFPDLKQASNSDTLCLFYDLEVSPITYDFCWVLSMTEVRRKKLGLKHLYIVLVPGPKEGLREEMEDYEKIVNINAREFRRDHLLLPLIQLVPSCISFTLAGSRAEAESIRKKMSPYIYPEQYHTDFPIGFESFYEVGIQKTKDALIFRATQQALMYVDQWLEEKAKGRKTIVITLRYYSYMPKRNSNIEAWSQFAGKLDPSKYFIVIIPDTEVAMQNPHSSLSKFEHFTPACWNVSLRAALYERCYLNLGINNGPFLLCWFNQQCRYIMFKILTPDVPQATKETLIMHGYTPNDPYPFLNTHQKWVWEDDSEEVIHREFDAMCNHLEN